MNEHWNKFELFFHHEFMNDGEFPDYKKALLNKELSFWFIPQDFTIYQEKSKVSSEIDRDDFHRNFFTFTWMLSHLPIPQVKNLMEFHYNHYIGEKEDFLENVYHELLGMKHHQGNREIAPPPQKILAMDWCKTRLISIRERNVYKNHEEVYFANQQFDALSKISSIAMNAKEEIILVDNYVDEKILRVLAGKKSQVKLKILTLEKQITPSLKVFIEAYNKQYKNLEVRKISSFHDRFMILDQTDFYHFGASLKDAGNKAFMYSKIEDLSVQEKLLNEVNTKWNT